MSDNDVSSGAPVIRTDVKFSDVYAQIGVPDYLNSGLIDDDLKSLFKDRTYFSYEPLLAQLVRELRNTRIERNQMRKQGE